MAQAPQTEEFITVSQAATLLHVDYETVRRWVAKGVFKHVRRVGPFRAIRLQKAEVLEQSRAATA